GAVERGLRMYDMFLLAFDCMPLAHLVRGASGEKKVFVVHGGLMQSPGVRLAHIAALKRKREIPYGYPGFEDKLYEDLMWSDPRPVKGTSPNTRGAGVYFGPDITQRFCATNGLSLVIRSHECVQEGYQFMHDDRLITVFSASQYCGRDTNRGAFIVFDSAMNMMLQQYVAGSLALTSPALKPPAPGRSSAGVYATGSETVATGACLPACLRTRSPSARECAPHSCTCVCVRVCARVVSSPCSRGARGHHVGHGDGRRHRVRAGGERAPHDHGARGAAQARPVLVLLARRQREHARRARDEGAVGGGHAHRAQP
ncbi:hypothetical protein EON67_10970, partial [archaeon]